MWFFIKNTSSVMSGGYYTFTKDSLSPFPLPETVNIKDIESLEKLVENNNFGYWMRTGNKSTNDGTGQRYEEVFHQSEMKFLMIS